MKRLLISLLVLAMASTAVAKLQISVNGDKNTNVIVTSDHILTMGIWTDAVIPVGSEISFALVIDWVWSGGDIDYTTGFTVPPYDTDPGIYLEHSMSAATAGFPLQLGEDGICGSIFLIELSDIEAGSVIFDGIDYYSYADSRINLYITTDWETSTLVDSVDIIIPEVPEPMTIGLLGLGALFLRKR
jgi:hypothetical protein